MLLGKVDKNCCNCLFLFCYCCWGGLGRALATLYLRFPPVSLRVGDARLPGRLVWVPCFVCVWRAALLCRLAPLSGLASLLRLFSRYPCVPPGCGSCLSGALASRVPLRFVLSLRCASLVIPWCEMDPEASHSKEAVRRWLHRPFARVEMGDRQTRYKKGPLKPLGGSKRVDSGTNF